MRMPWWLPYGHADEIRAKDLYSMVKDGNETYLLDVRETFEYKASHIEGAKNIPIHELAVRLDELKLDCDTPIVAICLSGHRSVPAFRILKRAGWHNVSSLHGGMMSWWRENLPVVGRGGE